MDEPSVLTEKDAEDMVALEKVIVKKIEELATRQSDSKEGINIHKYNYCLQFFTYAFTNHLEESVSQLVSALIKNDVKRQITKAQG